MTAPMTDDPVVLARESYEALRYALPGSTSGAALAAFAKLGLAIAALETEYARRLALPVRDLEEPLASSLEVKQALGDWTMARLQNELSDPYEDDTPDALIMKRAAKVLEALLQASEGCGSPNTTTPTAEDALELSAALGSDGFGGA